MSTYDPKDVQITIGGVPFDGFATVEYEDEPPAVVVDSFGRVRGTVVTGRRRGASSGGYRPGTRGWLADAIRRACPEPLLLVVDEPTGDGVVKVTIAPDRDGTLDASVSPALRAAVRDGLPTGVDLQITARTRDELVCAAGARAALDWMIRRVRRARIDAVTREIARAILGPLADEYPTTRVK